jgi:hypothetical protein
MSTTYRGQRIPGRRGLLSDGPTRSVTLRLPVDVADALVVVAGKHACSVNYLLVIWLREKLESKR